MKFINLLSITFLACCISFTEQFSFFFSYLIKQYFFSKTAILSLYVYDLYSFYSGVLLVLLYELQGHPMDLFLQIYFLRANFCSGRETWKKCYVLGRNLLLGNSQFRVSEEIQKGCRYVATPSQSYCRKNCSNAPSPEQVFELKPLTKRMDFTSNPRLLPALPQGFIKVHNHTAVYSWDSENNKVSSGIARVGNSGRRVCGALPTALGRQAMVWFEPI